MPRRLLALALALAPAACGRAGFDAHDASPAADALGALPCGASLQIAELPEAPLGIDLVATSAGAIAAWTRAAGAELAGVRLSIEGDAIVSAAPWSTSLPRAIGAFGLAADGDARLLLAGGLANGGLFLPLDGTLAAGDAWTIEDGLALTSRAVAEPIQPGGPFVAAAYENGEALMTLLDDTGAAIGPLHRRPAIGAVAIRRAAGRHVLAWTAPGGCAVWAFDLAFQPVLADPVIHGPGAGCLRPAITRHAAQGVNMLAWLDDNDEHAHAQLGTDTEYVGPELTLGFFPDAVELAAAPSGFFAAVASDDLVGASHVGLDGTGLRSVAALVRVPGSPIRLIARGEEALLATIRSRESRPSLWLTRLCE